MRNIIAPGLGIAALISVSALALASTEAIPIADVVDVIKSAFHTPPGGAEVPATVGDKLLADEAIRTESDSAIEMSFPDGATLRLEADSDLVLDSYVFDPNALKSAAAISIPAGIARYTTGDESIDDTGVEFSTPVATVGIRGTDIVVSVGANGATVIDVLSGKVTAKAIKHDAQVEAIEGQSVLIDQIDQPPEVGQIGDFATAAGGPPAAPGSYDPDSLKDRKAGEAPSDGGGNTDSAADGNDGNDGSGGGSGGSGGSGSGGGSSGGGGGGGGGGVDGDGNSGHGDNADKHDPDNPGGGKGKNNK